MSGGETILVVDDDEWSVRMVASLLGARGYRIETASNGEEGLVRARACLPDLIIADILMPQMDGWSLIRRLRADPDFALVPVIFLTALGSNEDRVRAFRLGVDDYLAKPFHVDELELRVANVLKRRVKAQEEVQRRIEELRDRDAAGVRGRLDQLGLSAILSLLSMERKSGLLVVFHGDETGRLFLRDGNVVHAWVEKKESGKPPPPPGRPAASAGPPPVPGDDGDDDGINITQDDLEPVPPLERTPPPAGAPRRPLRPTLLRLGADTRAPRGSLRNQEALYAMLAWHTGSFEFAAMDVDMEDEVQTSTTHLLLEAARRLDEADKQGT